MPQKEPDTPPHALVGRAGLVFAFVCFIFGLSMFGGAIYLLPLTLKAKMFLGAAAALLTSMFAFMAFATFRVLWPDPARLEPASRGTSAPDRKRAVDQKDVGGPRPADADGSHRLR